jgi:hypothetical protein
LYGHYREAKFTQTKHHWWWKANRVFDQLRATRNYNGELKLQSLYKKRVVVQNKSNLLLKVILYNT